MYRSQEKKMMQRCGRKKMGKKLAVSFFMLIFAAENCFNPVKNNY